MTDETKTFRVRRGEDDHPAEILAKEIEAIAQAAREMLACGLKRKTVVLLLHKASRVRTEQVERVLEAAETLDVEYLCDD